MAPTIKTRVLPVPISSSALDRVVAWRELVRDAIVSSTDSRVRALSPALVLALIYAESRGNPDAVSPEGSSYGLMQVNYAAHFASTGRSKSELLNPRINIIEGTKILAAMISQLGGDTYAAVSAYNGGGGKRHPIGTRFCLMWKAGAPTVNRNIDRDCALAYVTTVSGEFGNQPYVDEVMEAERRIINMGFGGNPPTTTTPPTTTPPTTGQAGVNPVIGIALAGAATVALLKWLRVF